MTPGPWVRWGGVKGEMRMITSAPLTDASIILLGHLQTFGWSEMRDRYWLANGGGAAAKGQ